MLKLIKLEMRKYKLGGYIRVALIANLIIFGLLCLISYVEKFENEMIFADYTMLLPIIDTFARATFIIFAAVLISRMVIGEFKNKSITVLFMYPINRGKIILAKLIIIVIFTFTWMIVTNVIQIAAFYVFDSFVHIVPGKLTTELMAQHAVSMVVNAVMASLLALIPLYFGMRKHSATTTIVSSILITILVCQNINGISVFTAFVAVPIVLSVISVLLTYLSIRNIEKIDVL
ncbi:ABC transporter permease [Paenibacillus sp. 32O-W]|uniref:ABC transporter permease n=1 Tax=Paenibacillus sp. 32O-W TaxID=1695218 RepID=UPI0021B6C74B|nr:ABC transporter permease [Paenibacillus sp. 32O-W]